MGLSNDDIYQFAWYVNNFQRFLIANKFRDIFCGKGLGLDVFFRRVFWQFQCRAQLAINLHDDCHRITNKIFVDPLRPTVAVNRCITT